MYIGEDLQAVGFSLGPRKRPETAHDLVVSKVERRQVKRRRDLEPALQQLGGLKCLGVRPETRPQEDELAWSVVRRRHAHHADGRRKCEVADVRGRSLTRPSPSDDLKGPPRNETPPEPSGGQDGSIHSSE